MARRGRLRDGVGRLFHASARCAAAIVLGAIASVSTLSAAEPAPTSLRSSTVAGRAANAAESPAPTWRRKGTASTNSLRPAAATLSDADADLRAGSDSRAASAMPRPFDAGPPSTAAPWAEPGMRDGRAGEAPDPIVASTRIRHVSNTVKSPGGPLQWRMKSGSAAATVRPVAHLQADDGGAIDESQAEPIAPGVQLNSPRSAPSELRTARGRLQAAPPTLDPAAPPVGPGTVEANDEEARGEAAPADDAPPLESAPTPGPDVESAPADGQDAPLPPAGRTPRATQPEFRAPRAAPEPLAPGAPPRRRETDLNMLRDVPCERMYGPDSNRNCCAEELLSQEARRRVKQLTISKIKVDITPTCNLAGEWSDAPETKCGWQLELSPPRVWKDRFGKEVAQGRFSGFANARVLITDEAGQTARVMLRDLSEDDRCFVTAWCGLPFESGLVEEPLLARSWQPLTMTWRASGLCHKPLYFEDVQLERYGHTSGPFLQPVVSGAHFFANIALLPYNMGIHPMNECQYSLGYYRPGSCAPRMIEPFPLSVRGAMMEAGAVLGGIYVIP